MEDSDQQVDGYFRLYRVCHSGSSTIGGMYSLPAERDSSSNTTTFIACLGKEAQSAGREIRDRIISSGAQRVRVNQATDFDVGEFSLEPGELEGVLEELGKIKRVEIISDFFLEQN